VILVSFYISRPGNGAGLFLQPWTPHGASKHRRSVRSRADLPHNKYILPQFFGLDVDRIVRFTV